jgi:hypothetical protein
VTNCAGEKGGNKAVRQQFFFCKKRTKKTFALRRGRWAGMGSPCVVAGASGVAQTARVAVHGLKKRCFFV